MLACAGYDTCLCQLLVVPEQLLLVGRDTQFLFNSLLDIPNGLLVLDPAENDPPSSCKILKE